MSDPEIDPRASPPGSTPWVPLWPLSSPAAAVTPPTNRLRIPIRLRVPRSTTLAGNAAFTVASLTAFDLPIWEFANNVQAAVYGYVGLPVSLAATPNPEVRLLVSSAVASGNMRWVVRTKCVTPTQSLNPAVFTSETIQTVASPGIWVMQELTFPLTEPISARGLLLLDVTRDGGNAGDTNEGSAYLVESYLEVNLGT